jgi:hypothetical protein
MELAIPLLALGGMYVISNQSSNNSTNPSRKTQNNSRNSAENFTNMGIRSNLGVRTDNYLPNTNIPPDNFPVTNLEQLADTVQEYHNPNVATDKYFNQNVYKNQVRKGNEVSNNPQQIYSMTGNYLDSKQFKHNNMVPFNGGKVKGNTYSASMAESQLDNMIGSGSQVIKKIEQAPLFKPEDNVSWAHGTPNNTAFYLSRQNPAMRNNNVKPFDTVRVGPGLNQGFTTEGTGGFNSGMEARDKWLPYTVDQLRVETNPKLEYELTNHEGPANSYIKNAASTQTQGRVEKQRPDTYFINSQDRWFTTTGAAKGETLRSIQEMGIVKRCDVETDYSGPAGNGDLQASYAPKNFEQSRRTGLPTCDVNHSSAAGRGPSDDKNIFMKSHTNYENNRSTQVQPDPMRSGFSGAIGAVIAPFMDLLKPTRKDETINNVRVYGDIGTAVSSGYVNNPNDTTATTVKETTLYSPNFNVNNQKEGLYVNNYTPTDLTQRDTTSINYIGTSGGAATQYGDMSYVAAYKQHNNDIKSATINNRSNQGGTQMFNQQMNVACKDDCDRFAGRTNPAFSKLTALPPSTKTYGHINYPQQYNQNVNCERIQPDILSAFKSNPYTHSLTTAV